MYTKMRTKKRFIAGAVCPKCQSLDTMMLFKEYHVEKVECTHCGYQKTQGETGNSNQSEASKQMIGLFKP
jgi:uncharacterized metal-binding protein (TIGR02443 family)